ncbi:MAG TPA: LytTR family DNA-binding domain-containing protein [Cyclobacteriaceae bacterium]|nr:LytTR family DNA-binding domain-containing protein [Cyclobacteriaceae bacterium]
MSPKKIRCLIVDDEPLAIEVLRQYIVSTPQFEIAGECLNALAAFEFLQKENVDVMFLDIQMPRLLGTDLIKSLPNPPRVIFTTAHRDFALDGFELGALDYLLKPITFERFLKSVYKLTHGTTSSAPERNEFPTERFLYFRSDRKMIKVTLNDILYIESLKDYVKIVTTRGQVITKQSISSVEAMLPDKEFVRIHRSFIIALNKVDSFTATDVMIGKVDLPVGPLYRHETTRRIQIAS